MYVLKLFADKLLKNGEEREVEIRACSIHAVEVSASRN